jgi:hypothetical protein
MEQDEQFIRKLQEIAKEHGYALTEGFYEDHFATYATDVLTPVISSLKITFEKSR